MLHRRQWMLARARMAAWAVGVAALAAVGLQIVVRGGATPDRSPNRCGCAVKPAEQSHVVGLHGAVDRFVIEHRRCPGELGELVRAGILRAPDFTDSWGRPYVFTCTADAVQVCSRADDELDAKDDLCSATQDPFAR